MCFYGVIAGGWSDAFVCSRSVLDFALMWIKLSRTLHTVVKCIFRNMGDAYTAFSSDVCGVLRLFRVHLEIQLEPQ